MRAQAPAPAIADLPVVRAALTAFRARFARDATHLAIAPGRVNLIGDHTDYSNGLAMPFAINRYLVACGAPAAGARQITAASSSNSAVSLIELEDTPIARVANWSDYLRGVVQGLLERKIAVPACDLLVHGDLPTGAGLSSSAALEISSCLLLLSLAGEQLAADELVQLAQAAEHRYAQMPCGALDQFAVTHAREGELMLFDSRSLSARQVTIGDPTLAFLIIDSGVKHTLAEGEYAARRRQCEQLELVLGSSLRDVSVARIEHAVNDGLLRRRGRHVVSENARVTRMAEALAAADRELIGELMFESHDSLRDDYDVTCAETDLLVELARGLMPEGVIGARQTGGGFGGAVIVVAPREAMAPVAARLQAQYADATGLAAAALAVQPVGAAQALRPRVGAS